jgi:predicted transcriptional regulator
MTQAPSKVENKLDEVIGLLQYLVALELSKAGVPQSTIGKHLHVAKASVVEMLRGATDKGR